MTSFKNVKIGERFYFDGFEYIKVFNSENGKKGAVRVCSGAYMANCENWKVEAPIKPTREEKNDNWIAVFTFKLWEDNPPVIMRITEEQQRIIEILHNYDIISG